MSENDQKRMLLPGVLMMLGLLLYVGTYFLARGTGRIIFIERGFPVQRAWITAPESDWFNTGERFDPKPSANSAFSKTMPLILNVVFWPLRILEAIYWDHLAPGYPIAVTGATNFSTQISTDFHR